MPIKRELSNRFCEKKKTARLKRHLLQLSFFQELVVYTSWYMLYKSRFCMFGCLVIAGWCPCTVSTQGSFIFLHHKSAVPCDQFAKQHARSPMSCDDLQTKRWSLSTVDLPVLPRESPSDKIQPRYFPPRREIFEKRISPLLLQGSLLSTTMDHCNHDLAAAVI